MTFDIMNGYVLNSPITTVLLMINATAAHLCHIEQVIV